MEKTKGRFREEEVTEARAYVIATILTAIYLVILAKQLSKIPLDKIIIVIVTLIITAVGLFLAILVIFGGIKSRMIKEKKKEMLEEFQLCQNKYKEVFYICCFDKDENKSILSALLNYECKCYAKFDGNDDVVLKIEDNDENVIFEDSFKSYSFFVENFKKDRA